MTIPIVVFILQVIAHLSPKEPPVKVQKPQQEIVYRALEIPDNKLVERHGE